MVEKKGFKLICLEADWPSVHYLNKYINSEGGNTIQAFSDFNRFPKFMWRNTTMIHFVEWLKDYNSKIKEQDKVRISGMDLYSLHSSMFEVIKFLRETDINAAKETIRAYECFDKFGEDPQSYAYGVALGLRSCRNQVVQVLNYILQKKTQLVREKLK